MIKSDWNVKLPVMVTVTVPLESSNLSAPVIFCIITLVHVMRAVPKRMFWILIPINEYIIKFKESFNQIIFNNSVIQWL